ncbi:FAD-dependent oxidoreductase [uncultured Hyphomonas sp.]|uniref:FAD-dependent oxidoreductase n=1 Tax=uncultured Hyphomonas sp. TaxID=225298 RepID=UPI002AAAD4E0|nr:FAD-dependent oxidoreductase [uncultured Hyphomonas sp.]
MVGTLTVKRRHILLAGGGHAHAVALRNLVKRPPDAGIRLTLVSPTTHNLYSGALPGVIAGHWQSEAIGVPLQPLCKAAGAEFLQDKIVMIDPDDCTATLASGKIIPFDLASLDIGSGILPLEADASHGMIVPIRPITPFLDQWHTSLARIKAGSVPPVVIVAGAGLAGIEVALAIHFRLQQEGIPAARTLLVDPGNQIAASSSGALRNKLGRALQKSGVSLNLETRIQTVRDHAVAFSSGAEIQAALVVNCAGSAPHDWISKTGLATVGGRIEVDACLRSSSHPHIWAAGDTSHFKPEPLAPAGVFAVRSGSVIAENIRRFSKNVPLSEFHPQSDYLKLVSLGSRLAVAEKFGLTLEGGWVWHLKKYIDFSFLREHSLPPGH